MGNLKRVQRSIGNYQQIEIVLWMPRTSFTPNYMVFGLNQKCFLSVCLVRIKQSCNMCSSKSVKCWTMALWESREKLYYIITKMLCNAYMLNLKRVQRSIGNYQQIKIVLWMPRTSFTPNYMVFGLNQKCFL
jgi:hypothetical protein